MIRIFPERWLLIFSALLMISTSLWALLRGMNTARPAWFLFVPYIGYYLLGFCLRERRDDALTPGVAVAVSLSAGIAIMAGEARRAENPMLGGAARFLFQGHFSPTVIALSLAVFLLFREATLRESPRATKFAAVSLGVYLTHPFVLELLGGIGVSAKLGGAWLGVPLTTLLLCGICGAASYGLQKIPWLRLVVGAGK
jgi:surface polysaccharide O-acyltransferase-like enzyme